MKPRSSARATSSDGLELAQLKRLELTSAVEATTLLLLIGVAVPLKHLAGVDVAVRLMGPVHGLAFASYVFVSLQTVSGSDWKRGDVARLFIAAVIPFGGFFNLRAIERRVALLRGRTAA